RTKQRGTDESTKAKQTTDDLTDAEGHLVFGPAVDAFAHLAKFAELDELVPQLRDGVDELVRLPGGQQLLRSTRTIGNDSKSVLHNPHLDDSKRDLDKTRPHLMCPYRAGKATHGCRGCNGTGWVTSITWDGAEDSIKERLQ